MLSCDIREFGAVGDGTTISTHAVQQAIDACAAAGGGRVTVSAGRFVIGMIRLYSGVDLHLAVDGTLLASTSVTDYPLLESDFWNTGFAPRYNRRCLIYAECCHDIAISGRGMIDCRGLEFCDPVENGNLWIYKRKTDTELPGRMVFLAGCRQVAVTDLTLKDPAAGWGFWILDCDKVRFDGITIDSNLDMPNSDGIHLNCSRDVLISNCVIRTGDDSIVVRAYTSVLKKPVPCERVAVTNCHLTSHCSAIRVAWANDYIIRDCVFSNLTITDSRVGLNMQMPHYPNKRLSDQGEDATLIERLSFDNIIIDRHWREPIQIIIADGAKVEAIRDLRFSNITSVSELPPRLIGRPDCRLKNIEFNNASFMIRPVENVTFKIDQAKFQAMNGNDAPYFAHVEDLHLNNVRFSRF